jgi:hypothetical protein
VLVAILKPFVIGFYVVAFVLRLPWLSAVRLSVLNNEGGRPHLDAEGFWPASSHELSLTRSLMSPPHADGLQCSIEDTTVTQKTDMI